MTRKLFCPGCGNDDTLGQIDLVPGFAWILGVDDDDQFVWCGETEMFWDEQRPAHNVPMIVCTLCDTAWKWENGHLAPYEEKA